MAQLSAGLRRLTDDEITQLRRALNGVQEQTLTKFGEAGQALAVLREGAAALREELSGSLKDWKRGQDLLGQAIGTLSQDFADSHKHATTVMNKLESDMYRAEQTGRAEKERLERVEVQLTGLQNQCQGTANELILLRSDRLAAGRGSGSGGGFLIEETKSFEHVGASTPPRSPSPRSKPGGGRVTFQTAHVSSGRSAEAKPGAPSSQPRHVVEVDVTTHLPRGALLSPGPVTKSVAVSPGPFKAPAPATTWQQPGRPPSPLPRVTLSPQHAPLSPSLPRPGMHAPLPLFGALPASQYL